MLRARHFGDDPDAEPPPVKRRRSWKQRLLLTTLGAFVATCLMGASVAGWVLVKLNSIDRFDVDIDQAPPGEPENFLLVGSDYREGEGVEGQRTDTIMVVRIDPGEEQASVLSLPRDLIVPIAGMERTSRINSAYAMGSPEEGVQRLIDTIRENFDIQIHHYVEVNFEGFARLVDTVGGVNLYFRVAMRDQHSGFFQADLGCQTLDGQRALQFVRSRHVDFREPDGWKREQVSDLGRIARQQLFIEQALSKTLKAVRSMNPARLTQLVADGVDMVGLDNALSIGDLQELADRFRGFNTSALRTYPLPVVDNEDGATLSMDERAAEPILNVFRGQDPGEVSPRLISVRVLNGSGEQGQANNVAGALDSAGFDVVEAGNVPEGAVLPNTQIHFALEDQPAAERLLRHLSAGAEMVPDGNVSAGTIELWTGTDFTTVHDQPTPRDQMTTTTTAPPAGGGVGGGGETASTTAAPTTTTAPPTTTTTRPPEQPQEAGQPVTAVPPNVDC